ncbi:glycosyltransferase family A protein [Nocardioides exalbidus]|uniref:glycosyltransferase family A protein n=1 Tax=Nocardioides exalbidus TaxID=402596 RepID=UPI000B836653|nr:glycosyltransferase family A protein [Nocardioides exalbidus]
MTRITVVVPCYNDGTYLHEAIESALKQDHEDIEVIVSDDGSSDTQTLRALDALPDLGVKVMRGAHAGVSAARNAAIEAATGDYILPLDADDRLAPDFASAAGRVLDSDVSIGVVGCGTELFGSSNAVVHPRTPHPTDWLVSNQLPVTALFRRSDWRACGGYPLDLRWGEDWYFWVKLVALGRGVTVLPMIGLHYRQRPDQVTSHVPWDIQENTRGNVLRAGLPIVNSYPVEATTLLAAHLNQLQAVRERRSERLRTRIVSMARRG